MSENFYEILGVNEKSTKDEIKKAYRKLSLQWHPDKNPGNVEAISKFQKISEAYETLGDDHKRMEYDSRNNNPFMRMNSMGGNGEFPNMDEIFSTMFGNNGPFSGMMHGMGGMNGMHGMHGMPGMPGVNVFPPGANIHIFRNGVPVNIPQKPNPIVKNVVVNMEQVLNGANVPVEIERWILENGNKTFEKETFYIEVPKGIDENEMFFFKDKGHVVNDNCKGDVKIVINITNETNFNRNGLDLIYEKTITLKEALCGFSFELKYINGKAYTINNNSGNIIVPEYNKIIPNMGLTRESYTGNLIIHFSVQFPDTLSKETIDKLKEIL